MRSAHWRVYAVARPTPLAQGRAVVRAMGSDWVALDAVRAGTVTLHVRFTPYWKITQGKGCVAPDGDATRLTVSRAGPVTLAIRFAPGRIGAPRRDARDLPLRVR